MHRHHPSVKLENSDCRQGLKRLEDRTVHATITDIPYGIGADSWDVLHTNTNSAYLGSSPAQKAAGNGAFKRRGKPLNGWSTADREIPKQYQEWCDTWMQTLYEKMIPGGSVIIFAGRRMSTRCAISMEEAGFTFKDQLAWLKPNAAHRAQRVSVVFDRRGDIQSASDWEGWRLGNLRPRFEPILWFTKPYQQGSTIADNLLHNQVGAYNEAALEGISDDSSNILSAGLERNEPRIHPTQKPVKLMSTLIELVTLPGQIVLDPFAGSGTTLVAAQQLGRRGCGFEIDRNYFEAAESRLHGRISQK